MSAAANIIWLTALSIIVIAIAVGVCIWQGKQYKMRRTIREVMRDQGNEHVEEDSDGTC